MTNSNTIEAISSGGKKINVDINKLLENIPLYEFYKTGFTENFTPSNGVFYDFDIGVARDGYWHDTIKPHKIDEENKYYNKKIKDEFLSKEEFFKAQTEMVTRDGVAFPRFIEDIIPKDAKVLDWQKINSLSSIKEKCWIVNCLSYYNNPSYEIFEFDPELNKKRPYHWSNPSENKGAPKITHQRYDVIDNAKEIRLRSVFIDGVELSEKEAFIKKIKYDNALHEQKTSKSETTAPNNDSIEVIYNDKKTSIKIKSLLDHVPVSKFYEYGKLVLKYHSNGIFFDNSNRSPALGLIDKQSNFVDIYKPHLTGQDLYFSKATEGVSSDRGVKNWFKHQMKLVPVPSGKSKIPRFVRDLIPNGEGNIMYVSDAQAESADWVFYKTGNEIEIYKYGGKNPEKFLTATSPEITCQTFQIDPNKYTITLKEVFVNGKQVTEEEAFRIKAEFELKRYNLKNDFHEDFLKNVYDKLSYKAKLMFEADNRSTTDKITYISTKDSWSLACPSIKETLNNRSNVKEIENFIQKVNEYYNGNKIEVKTDLKVKDLDININLKINGVDNSILERDLTATPARVTLSDKQENHNLGENIMAAKQTTKEKVVAIAISDGKEVAKRVATKQISKIMQDTLVKALTQDLKGKKKTQTKTALEEFFASEKGMAVIQVICGIGLPFASKYIPEKYHDKLETISTELRIQGETTAALELIGAVEPLIQMAASGIMDSLSSLTAAEELVRVETETVETISAPKHQEAEVVELSSAKERAKA
ncbi:MAG TPA: hypothetical protein PLP33_16390 [Leptospiraceae bacterium]|nr:hypothetical protein [Leptospiraceae bacterium]